MILGILKYFDGIIANIKSARVRNKNIWQIRQKF